MCVKHPQLDQEALDLLKARVELLGERSKVAAELGYCRSAISQAMDGKYPGGTARMRAKIIEAYASRIDCPHLGVDLAPETCREYRERTMQAALGSRDTVKLWQACRICSRNPDAKTADKEGAA